jgi:hypothetical protein
MVLVAVKLAYLDTLRKRVEIKEVRFIFCSAQRISPFHGDRLAQIESTEWVLNILLLSGDERRANTEIMHF